jgi:hypothetical protein
MGIVHFKNIRQLPTLDFRTAGNISKALEKRGSNGFAESFSNLARRRRLVG